MRQRRHDIQSRLATVTVRGYIEAGSSRSPLREEVKD
jgi:hypothetical protein